MFKLFKKESVIAGRAWRRHWSESGVHVVPATSGAGGADLDSSLVDAYLTQLVDDGLSVESQGTYLIDWDGLYAALGDKNYGALRDILKLPKFTDAQIALRSSQSLADRNFSIAVAGWQRPDGGSADVTLTGPLLDDGDRQTLMSPQQWSLFKDVVAFSRREDHQRDDLSQRRAWGSIRKSAVAAGARLDDFLHRSVVLTPEKLHIGLRRSEVVKDDRVVEVEPSFTDAPQDWLETFDSFKEVQGRYDIVTPEGIVQVLITPKVRTVLQEIKRLKGRRVAGSRAEAFLLNPYATLGSDAADVIEEQQFETAREGAGLTYERFTPSVERDAGGYPTRVGLLIESAAASGPTSSDVRWLDDAQLERFVRALQQAVRANRQLLAWDGVDLLLDGNAGAYLHELESALKRRLAPSIPTVSYAQVHDLSGYSARIEGIGEEKPYYSPHIAKKGDEASWWPEDIYPVVVYTPNEGGEPIAVPTTKPAIEKLKKDIEAAERKGQTEVKASWLPGPMSLDDAKRVASTFDEVFKDIESGRELDMGKYQGAARNQSGPKKQLVLRANIQAMDYEEMRREAMESVPALPTLPSSINPEFTLLKHQQEGLAWMQHLYQLQNEYQVRGAVLADDMGLGKTFQLLSLMCWLIEQDPKVDPMLVVAPVALLENWAQEAEKFFSPGALSVMTAYGPGLTELRVPRAEIDERLLTEDGLVKFLKPNWVGSAKVVLTTYETLRDLEFSFAAQRWSLMVCDEAQRIKNPAAMVTRAAKKQNAAFRIACTGTPVENTLADLWCLFDFVQPGLLGALNDFGNRYRRPIEAKTDEELARVEELQAKIKAQILRRLKSEVATDLPPKVVVDECRRLPLSTIQRNLYSKSVESFKKRGDPSHPSPFKNHLGLLHYLRLVCTDPRPHGLSVFKPEPVKQYREKAPKLDWLLRQLSDIRAQNEKVIVFCEFREIQRLLQHYVEEAFGLKADIINGDTSASSSHAASRQKRIKAFQDAPGFGVLILSPVAVGFGVNIQAANHVVHYTRTWNPAKEDQATDRAYRIGQKKPVYVYYPVVKAEDFTTFDVKLDQLLEHKRSLAGNILNGAGDVVPGDFVLTEVVPEPDSKDLDERVTLDMALRMPWNYFECLTGALWSRMGYACYRTPGTADNGVDVVALAGDKGQLVQAKTSGRDGAALGWEAVKDVVAGEAFYKRRHPGVSFEKACITNQYFNRLAHENAALNGVKLLDQTHLSELLAQHDITMLDVERVLFAEWKQVDETTA